MTDTARVEAGGTPEPGSKPGKGTGMGSVSDAAGPLLDALQSAAKAAAAESLGDSHVIAAVRLGWLMEELTHGWLLNPLPPDLSLTEDEKCQAQALKLSLLLDALKLPGLERSALERLGVALRRGPAVRAAREAEQKIIVSLAGSEARLATAYDLGGRLRALIGDGGDRPAPAFGAQESRTVVGALDALSSDLPSHAARGVANSLGQWSLAANAAPARLADAQVNLWRAVIVGDKKATELLEPDDYLDAARQLEAKFARRALSSKWLWAVLALAIILFGLGVYLLFVANGHAGKVAAGATGVIAALGLTWKGIGGTLGKLVAKLEGPLWGAELDAAVTDAITLTKTPKRKPSTAVPRGLSYADRRGRALPDNAEDGPDRGSAERAGRSADR